MVFENDRMDNNLETGDCLLVRPNERYTIVLDVNSLVLFAKMSPVH